MPNKLAQNNHERPLWQSILGTRNVKVET